MTNGTREFFGNKLEKALEVIEIGQPIQRDLALSALTRNSSGDSGPQALSHPCPCCGGRMIIIETFERGSTPRYRPTVPIRIDAS